MQPGLIQQSNSGRNGGPGSSIGHSRLQSGSPPTHDDLLDDHDLGHNFGSDSSVSTNGNAPHQPRKFMTYINKPSTAPRPSNSNETSNDQVNGREEEVVYPPTGPAHPVSDTPQECYHEVHAIPLLDPVLDKPVSTIQNFKLF